MRENFRISPHHRSQEIAQRNEHRQPADGHIFDGLILLLVLLGLGFLALFIVGLTIGSTGLAITGGILTGLMLLFFIVSGILGG